MLKPFVSNLLALAIAALPLAATPAAANDRAAAPIASEWANPSNSVHVRIDRCGGSICGTVTWASAKAIADARRGGTENLVGIRLFRNLEPAGDSKWKGKVFVPDIRQTFSGTIHFAESDKMVGKGCVLFGIVCKSQTWSRVR